MRKLTFILLVITLGISCEKANPEFQSLADDPSYLHNAVQKLTDIIIHDIFSPPQASRIYVYPSIAAYEVMQNANPSFLPLEGQLRGFESVPKPSVDQEYCYPLAAFQAFTLVGKTLIFSEQDMEDFRQESFAKYREIGIPKKIFQASLDFGEKMANHILDWADKDLYKQTRTYPKHAVVSDPGKWQPTPPAYMSGIEPHWREIRPFVIDSATQFVPKPPTTFSKDKDSQFYEEAMEVYEVLNTDEEEKVAIAGFWDCNPYVMNQVGHVMFATKKITPGGHWMGIAGIAAKKTDANTLETSEALAWTAIALADGFISCWDEKYRSNLTRPETYINSFIDEDWVPALQTPPFPEHTSGHSVISTAAGEVLTHLFGDNFEFEDTVEVAYGLPKRSFTSFRAAYQEAAVSRLYGGIHYRPAIDYGVEQGKSLGDFIINKLTTRNSQLSSN